MSNFIIEKFRPTWYEAKEERNEDGKTVWFHGFEAMIQGELWNIDIWFFDKQTIDQVEKFCDSTIQEANRWPECKDRIVEIKKELIARQLYSAEQYTSLDVYEAVLHQHISNIEDFLTGYNKR